MSVGNLLDSPSVNDNRSYSYRSEMKIEREEYGHILAMIPSGSRVIDFGCGDGSLLQLLRDKKNCEVVGIELSPSGVAVARSKGLEIFEGRADESWPLLKDLSFDFAVCNVTIQMLMYPENLLVEMGRLARQQIISFPNFAFYQNRIDLLISGRMPRPSLFGYKWYSTGHIHQLSYLDFLELSKSKGFLIKRSVFLPSAVSQIKRVLINLFPNLFSRTCILLLTKQL